MQTDKHTDKRTDRHTYTETDIQTDRQDIQDRKVELQKYKSTLNT